MKPKAGWEKVISNNYHFVMEFVFSIASRKSVKGKECSCTLYDQNTIDHMIRNAMNCNHHLRYPKSINFKIYHDVSLSIHEMSNKRKA